MILHTRHKDDVTRVHHRVYIELTVNENQEKQEVARMAFVTFAALLSLASLATIAFAQSVNGSTSPAPSWTSPYLQVYPPLSADEIAGRTKSLYFALTMSFGGNFKSSGTIPGVQTALDGINSDPTLLPGYRLHYTLTDSRVRA